MISNNRTQELHQPSGSSLAFCPAEITTSNGKGAKEDQYSCFEIAISAHTPGNKQIGEERSKKKKSNTNEEDKFLEHIQVIQM